MRRRLPLLVKWNSRWPCPIKRSTDEHSGRAVCCPPKLGGQHDRVFGIVRVVVPKPALTSKNFEIGRILHLKSAIRDLRLDQMQDSSNLKIAQWSLQLPPSLVPSPFLLIYSLQQFKSV